jgi:hypothetical protein
LWSADRSSPKTRRLNSNVRLGFAGYLRWQNEIHLRQSEKRALHLLTTLVEIATARLRERCERTVL